MSGETEIEVSVVSEEDLDLETSRGSPTSGELLLQDGKNGKSGGCLASTNPFGFEMGKATLRPACNAQYTSFSISSILGRAESPPSDSASAGRASPPRSGSPNSSARILSPTTLRLGAAGARTTTAGDGVGGMAASPLTAGFGTGDANNPLMSHQASADLTMLSR